MKLILSALLIAMTNFCNGQTYKCGAQSFAGTAYKLEMDIIVNDSAVVFISQGKETLFKRLPSSDAKVYFTDGQVKNSLYAFPNEGTKKGFTFNHIITQEMNLAAPQVIQSYCWLKRD